MIPNPHIHFCESGIPGSRRLTHTLRSHSRRSNTTGFTLVELAIVIVIAGILAAVAVPIYRGLIDDSKWSEARVGMGAVRSALDVYRAKNSGRLPGIAVGPVSNFATLVGVDANSLANLRYFNNSDFTMIAVDTNTGTYTLQVDGQNSTNNEAPRGVIVMNEAGDETGP